MRAYRAAPRIAAALAPAFPPSRSLLERAHEAFAELSSRLPGMGGGTDSAAQMAAAGGTHGVGVAAAVKLLAVCAGVAGGAAACVATGVLPDPLVGSDRPGRPAHERAAHRPGEASASEAVEYEPASPSEPQPPAVAKPEPKDRAKEAAAETAPAPSGAIEYEAPPPAPEPPPPSTESAAAPPSGSAAGEFGP
jgi:hypothetical protein